MMALSVDARWPRAGDWAAPGEHGSALALIGIPTFETSLSATRADTTPAAVREALRYYSEFVSPDRGVERRARTVTTADWGDIERPDGDRAGAILRVAAAAELSELLIAVGGDNSATVPAALGTWGDRIATAGLVTVDAHHDLRDGRSNGSPVRELVEAGLDGSRVVQLGIADFANSADYSARARDYGITVIHRSELERRPMADVMAEALAIAGAAGGPVHVDLDVDACDRSVVPACPAAVPGGISALELRTAARVAARHRLVESIDLTEVDATADAQDQRTIRLVALCVLEALAGLSERSPR